MTHGAIDGYSRLIVYLNCSLNNRASTVYRLFLTATTKYNLPSRVRSDEGLENIEVARHMLSTRGEERRSMITGSSTHNQRIERLWRDMHRSVTVMYYKLFYFMEHHGLLESLNEHHLWALQYTYMPRINRALKEFMNSWNNHPIRTTEHKSPLQLFTAGAILLQNSNLEGLDFFQDVDHSYGSDPDGPIPAIDGTHVQVPQSTLRFSDSDIADLQRVVDPCATSGNYGMDLYQSTLQFISNLNTV